MSPSFVFRTVSRATWGLLAVCATLACGSRSALEETGTTAPVIFAHSQRSLYALDLMSETLTTIRLMRVDPRTAACTAIGTSSSTTERFVNGLASSGDVGQLYGFSESGAIFRSALTGRTLAPESIVFPGAPTFGGAASRSTAPLSP